MENTNTQPANITIADLDLLRQVVDLASSRGAFRGAELSQVGEVYNKLTTFVESVMAQNQQDAAQQPAAVQQDLTQVDPTPQGE